LKREHPNSAFQQKLISAEVNWTIHQLEACTQKMETYLRGTPFTVLIDHVSLKWMRKTKGNAKRLRWGLQLEDFDFEVVHRAEKLSGNADSLSRITIPETRMEDETKSD
jgi:hypothetical protein